MSEHYRSNRQDSNRYNHQRVQQPFDEHRQKFAWALDAFNLSRNTPFDMKLYEVLSNLIQGVKLSQAMREWLWDHQKQPFINSSVLRCFHSLEAQDHLNNYQSEHDPVHLIRSAEELIKGGMQDKACALLSEHTGLADHHNEKTAAHYHLTYARALHDLRKYQEAEKQAEDSYRLNKEEPDTHLLLASICLHRGAGIKAVKWYGIASANGDSEKVCEEHMKNSLKTVSLSIRHEMVKLIYDLNREKYKFLRALLPPKMR